MDVISKSTLFFLFSLNLGLNLFLCLINSRETGAGLIKLFNSFCIGCLIIALIIARVEYAKLEWFFWILNLNLILYAFNYFTRKDEAKTWDRINFIVSVIISFLFFYILKPEGALDYLFLLSSGLILGIVTFAMVLGHWYLVVPKLSEKPLILSLYILWALMLVKLPFIPYTLIHNKSDFELMSGHGDASFNWILLIMRFGWSYLVMGIMSYFTYRLAKMRSLQSATGILYVMTFFEFAGELIGIYLYYQYGWML